MTCNAFISTRTAASIAAIAVAGLFSAAAALAQSQPVIGLITKTETNPFFV